MPSRLLGEITLDDCSLSGELNTIFKHPFNNKGYKEFICGEWKSCAIWNLSGVDNDVRIKDYQGQAQQTHLGKQLLYLNSMIKNNFNLQYLKYARLVILGSNSVVIPHRDYLELKQGFLRIHIPLKTSDACYNSEENQVYNLKKGEVWYLDASLIHSAACLADIDRLHLILDFSENIPIEQIFTSHNQEINFTTQPIERENISTGTLNGIYHLASLIDLSNFFDVIGIITKLHFLKNISATDVFNYLKEIANLSQKKGVCEKVDWLERYCLTTRNEQTV